MQWIDDYYERVRLGSHLPNFFMSYEYFFHCKPLYLHSNRVLGVKKDGQWLLPPLLKDGRLFLEVYNIKYTFLNQIIRNTPSSELSFLNYVFEPETVDFSCFKEIIDWKNKYKKGHLCIEAENTLCDSSVDLFERWIMKNERKIWDVEFLGDMVYNSVGKKWLLKERESNKLLGFILFDVAGFGYVNLRWIICEEYEGLEMFLRWIFYTCLRGKKLLVNEACGLIESKKILNKLKPKMICEIYSMNIVRI